MVKKSSITKIPLKIKKEVNLIIKDLNNRTFDNTGNDSYVASFKGSYLYIDRNGNHYEKPCPVCRLEYTGDTRRWKFSIYRYSLMDYDPEEWMFPGAELVDGSIEGALKACLKAYPG